MLGRMGRLCLVVWLLACVIPVAGVAGQLTYVERSQGLHTIDMEEGDTEIEIGDVNGDGHPDIVSIGDHGSPFINSDQHGVMVWFGDGAGGWSIYQSGNFGYGGVALGDVNNDGLMDVGYGHHHDFFAEGDFGDQIMEVALGDGTGQNWTPWDDGLAGNGETWGMFGTDFADVDNDGDLDIGSVSFGGSNGARIYLNQRDGTWVQSSAMVGGSSSQRMQFGDVNGDGNADFVADYGSATVRLGDGTGSFVVGDGNLPGSSGRKGTALGDLNADGRDDLVFVNSSGGLAAFTLVEDGNWQSLSGNLPASGSFDLAQIADMDLDGFGDVVAYGDGNPARTRVYLGDGAGNWVLGATITHPQHDDYAAFRAGTDFDHNGYPDFAVVGKEYVGGFPFSWRNRLRAYAEGSTPTGTFVFPKSPRGGETWVAGSVRFIDWHAASAGNPNATMTISFSVSGPDGPWTVIAEGVPNSGRYQWQTPAPVSTWPNCFLRFNVDGVEVVTPEPFTIMGDPVALIGDMNCDHVINNFDIDPFVLALTDPAAYEAAFPGCTLLAGDINGDGVVNNFDIDPFVALLTTK